MAHAILIGPDQQDNLALRYLASATEIHGHSVSLARYNDRRDLESCVASVLNDAPRMVGISIPFQYTVRDQLDLARALRSSGFGGHLTCGGHVPTFCFEEILSAPSDFDSVVRHEGERTLPAMLDAIDAGNPLTGIPGMVWREGDRVVAGPVRIPEQKLDDLCAPRLREDGPLSVGGAPIGFIRTGRGCHGSCTYCSIGAFTRDSGGARLRLRSPEAVAHEIAMHRRIHGIRTFFVQNDLFILPGETRAISRMNEMRDALEAQNVADSIFWVKGRPESITPAVARAARELGVVHMFLGVESDDADRLRYLGRTHGPEQNRAAIEICLENRIRPSFNLMMFDPESSLEQVATTVDLAGRYPTLPWNICRTEIYSGTTLLKQLRAEGRLLGDYRTYGYRIRDERAEAMFRIMRVSFHERAFAVDSLLNKLISISFARQVHEEFYGGRATDEINSSVDSLIEDTHVDSVVEMRRIMDFVAATPIEDSEAIRDFAVKQALEMTDRDLRFHDRFRKLWSLLNARGATLNSLGGAM